MSMSEFGRRLMMAGERFVFPRACLWCERPLTGSGWHAIGPSFCPRCHGDLSPPAGPRCRICSAPVGPQLDTLDGCMRCREEHFSFQRVYSLGVYQDELKWACLRCKHTSNRALVTALTDLLWERNRVELQAASFDGILPMPHHWSDRLLRPWQPPDTIAERLGHFLMIPVIRDILRKVRKTPRQLSLSASARRRNLRSAFKIDNRVQFGEKRLLIVDDILTTGTTAQRVARTLIRAGGSEVHVAVIARGIGA